MGVGWIWWVLLPGLLCRTSVEGSLSTLPPHPSLWLHTFRSATGGALISSSRKEDINRPVQVSH